MPAGQHRRCAEATSSGRAPDLRAVAPVSASASPRTGSTPRSQPRVAALDLVEPVTAIERDAGERGLDGDGGGAVSRAWPSAICRARCPAPGAPRPPRHVARTRRPRRRRADARRSRAPRTAPSTAPTATKNTSAVGHRRRRTSAGVTAGAQASTSVGVVVAPARARESNRRCAAAIAARIRRERRAAAPCGHGSAGRSGAARPSDRLPAARCRAAGTWP